MDENKKRWIEGFFYLNFFQDFQNKPSSFKLDLISSKKFAKSWEVINCGSKMSVRIPIFCILPFLTHNGIYYNALIREIFRILSMV